MSHDFTRRVTPLRSTCSRSVKGHKPSRENKISNPCAANLSAVGPRAALGGSILHMNSWIASLPFVSSPKKGDSDRWVSKERGVEKGCAGHDSETSIMWSEAPGNSSTVFGCTSPCSKYQRKLLGLEGLVSISLQDEDFCVSPPAGPSPRASPTKGRRIGASYFLSKSLSVRNILSPRREKVEGCDNVEDSGILLPFQEASKSEPVAQSTLVNPDKQRQPGPKKVVCGNSSRKEIEIDFRDLVEPREDITLDTCETSAPAGQGLSLRSRLHRSISEFFSSRGDMKCEIDLDDIFEAKNQDSLEPATKASRDCSSADSRLLMLHRSMSEIFSSRLGGCRAPPVPKANHQNHQSEAEPKDPPPLSKITTDPRPARTEPLRRTKHSDLHRSRSEVFSSRSTGGCDPKQRLQSDSPAKSKNHKESKQRTNRSTPENAQKVSSSQRKRAPRRHSMPNSNAKSGLKDLLEAYDMIMSMSEPADSVTEATASGQRNEAREQGSPVLNSAKPGQDPAVALSTQKTDINTAQRHDDTTVTDEDEDDDDDDDDQNVSYLRPASGDGPAPHGKWNRGAPTSRCLERGLSLLDEKDEEPATSRAKALQSNSSLFESTGW
jgi:hypothetical protein